MGIETIPVINALHATVAGLQENLCAVGEAAANLPAARAARAEQLGRMLAECECFAADARYDDVITRGKHEKTTYARTNHDAAGC